ncbi:hypothetical protein [Tessaracoccus coleopterorum]|uniref:hypothetical protein n=1 Tax=Tessaracoccus coleopterorum TaxID=2714950 RepID=UPI002F90D0AF
MQYPYTAVTGLFDTVDFEIGVAGIPESTAASPPSSAVTPSASPRARRTWPRPGTSCRG